VDILLISACIAYAFLDNHKREHNGVLRKPTAIENIVAGILFFFAAKITIFILAFFAHIVFGGNNV
jgi:hypothetical protein